MAIVENQMMVICENCGAKVPNLYQGSDARKYCCASCLFNPLGCRCRFGELGTAENTDYGQFEDDLPPEARHDVD